MSEEKSTIDGVNSDKKHNMLPYGAWHCKPMRLEVNDKYDVTYLVVQIAQSLHNLKTKKKPGFGVQVCHNSENCSKTTKTSKNYFPAILVNLNGIPRTEWGFLQLY